MQEKSDYPKKIISFDLQISRLQERGLIIDDPELAKEYLRNISYFRLQGFWWEFQKDKTSHKFQENIKFEDVINLYTFDRKLRLILFDALERIEIALRTKLVYYPSIELDQWWFENPKNFFIKDFHKDTLAEIDKDLKRTKEVFIQSHYNKYGTEHRPPVYKTLEVISFGCLSKLYSNLNNTIPAKKRIAKEFNLPNHQFLQSWLKTFNTTRNIIAHHSRIWNRNIDFAPKILEKTEYAFVTRPDNEHSMYYTISAILYVLNKVSKGHSIKPKLLSLFQESEFINFTEMGFPKNWKEELLWK